MYNEAMEHIDSIEVRVSELQRRVSGYLSMKDNEMLKELLPWIEKNVTKEVVDRMTNIKFQRKLEDATTKVADTPLDIADSKDGGKLVMPIKEGYTVVAVDEKGLPIGCVHKPVSAYEGFNVVGVAYEKALLLKILEDEGKTGGLRDGDNMRSVQKRGFTRHWGSANKLAKVEDVGKVALGASGVGQGDEENMRLLDGGIPSTYTNAGLFDTFMADQTRIALENPDIPAMPSLEPDWFEPELSKH